VIRVTSVNREAPRMRPVDDRQHAERRPDGGGVRGGVLALAVVALGAATSLVAYRFFPDPDGGFFSWTTAVLTVVAAVVAVTVHAVRRRRRRA
jgi:hypothetical protein